MPSIGARILHTLTRRKFMDSSSMEKSNLKRSLTVFDLTFLGVGSTLGAGAYVLSGQIAKNTAGPATVISFLIAAIASMFAGLCYAEFGGRVPKAGSVYTFSYVTIGEYIAFVIGWDLLLEYIIGVAAVARTASGYFDFLANSKISYWEGNHTAMHLNGLGSVFDPLAMGLVIAIAVILALGVKESTLFNNVFTILNLLVLTFIILAGAKYDKPSNWKTTWTQVTNSCGTDIKKCGEGGFAPWGFNGILTGAASAFFGFVGFDAIATTGEEVKNPKRAIPLSIMLSLLIIFVYYFLISLTVTMVLPYYELSGSAPLAEMFKRVGLGWAQYVVSAGALCALSTSLLGAMFPLPRVILSMSRDGLLFPFLGWVHPKLKTAIIATMIMGLFGGILASVFDVKTLVDMMSIGTLLAYSLVSSCALLLRYEATYEDLQSDPTLYGRYAHMPGGVGEFFRMLFPKNRQYPNLFSGRVVKITTIMCDVVIVVLCAILTFIPSRIFKEHQWWAVLVFAVCVVFILICNLIIWRQPESVKPLYFKAPLMPAVPFLSVFCNIFLMFQLSYMTWIRFVVWLAIGFIIYITYSWWHSEEQRHPSITSDSLLEMYDSYMAAQKEANKLNGETDSPPPVYNTDMIAMDGGSKNGAAYENGGYSGDGDGANHNGDSEKF